MGAGGPALGSGWFRESIVRGDLTLDTFSFVYYNNLQGFMASCRSGGGTEFAPLGGRRRRRALCRGMETSMSPGVPS